MKKQSDFQTQKDFFKYLVENKSEIIDLKKSAIKLCDPFGTAVEQIIACKALNTSYRDDITTGMIKRSIIGNTYNWMDSHDDVLLDGVFAKSISETHDKIWHLHDHEHKLASKIGKPVSIYEKTARWRDLGVNINGKTMALFMDSNIIKDYNPMIFNMYLNGEINQHSVGMRYVQLELAVNDEDMKQEFAVYKKYIDIIGNKEKVESQGFFFAVKEGKLIEISAVLAGSNELTPTVENIVNLQKSINIDWYGNHFQNEISRLDKSKPVFVYCLSGGRSSSAASQMRSDGFNEVYELNGGIMNWRAANLPETTNPTVTSTGMTKRKYDELTASNKTVLIDFYADWCAPCKKMKPYLDEISKEMSGKITVIRVNADENQQLCKELKVNTLPVLKLYKNRKLTWTNTGFIGKESVLKQIQLP